MAYPYYPNQQMQYPTQPNAYQNPTQIPQQPVQQMQNGGYVIVQNEDEVRRYPVAHGNLVTFRIENQPVVIEKSMGFSQFDTPHYEKYKLVKEDMEVVEQKEYILKSDYENAKKELFVQISDLKSQFEDVKKQIEEKKPVRKKEVEA